jgi:hypothetical protein
MEKHALHFILLALALVVCTKLSLDAVIIGAAALFVSQVKAIKL